MTPQDIPRPYAPNAVGPGVSGSVAHQNLNMTLSANALNAPDASLSRTPTTAGIASPALAAAMSRGVVNPAEWLSPSDIKLFEQATGGTIHDGVIYDKDGNAYGDPANSDLVNSLFDMRNFGTFSGGQPRLITGDISVNDLKAYIDYNRTNSALNIGILDRALEALSAQG
ncbi:MAG: hypothetical protein QE484_00685 [Rhizobium sp.]|nr:hypothetical protein [Rhizobium sp.]